MSVKSAKANNRYSSLCEVTRIIAVALRPPADWRRPAGRPRTTWPRTADKDVQPQNFGVYTVWRKAKDRDIWRQVISTTTV